MKGYSGDFNELVPSRLLTSLCSCSIYAKTFEWMSLVNSEHSYPIYILAFRLPDFVPSRSLVFMLPSYTF